MVWHNDIIEKLGLLRYLRDVQSFRGKGCRHLPYLECKCFKETKIKVNNRILTGNFTNVLKM
jgi:hypothetical protein